MPTPTPLQRRESGWRGLPPGSWFNDIIDRVNALIAGTVSVNDLTVEDDLTVGGDATITGGLSVDDITADDVSMGDLVQDGITTYTAQTVAAAGATQGTATQITKSSVMVTVTASTQGVKLPVAAAGKRVMIFGALTVGVKVYPATGDRIGASSTNAAVVLASAKGNIYQALDGTTWRVIKGA